MTMKVQLPNLCVVAVLLGGVLAGCRQSQDSASMTLTEVSLSGVVTDDTGKPVRGAIVKATMGAKTVARYSDAAGHYDIPGWAPGEYEVSVDAFGFAVASQKTQPSQGGKLDFKLSPQMELARLTSAEMQFLLPDDDRGAQLTFTLCGACHGLETVAARSGMTQQEWAEYLPNMYVKRFGRAPGSPESGASQAAMVVRVFGPDGILGPNAKLDFSKVKYTPLKDSALRATITEYTIPSPGAMPMSVTVDDNSGLVWFSEYDASSNNMTRFDPKTETFKEYPIPVAAALAHTGDVLADGTYIVGMDREEAPSKLVSTTPDGKVALYDWPEKPQGARVVEGDPSDASIVWAVAWRETWRLNAKTGEFKAYKNPVPDRFPEGSLAAMGYPGFADGSGYDVTVDSKGIPWVSQLGLGTIFRLDPATGETKSYHTPEMASVRGIEVDADDRIWFADYHGHKIGVLDPATGDVKLYKLPNPHATPYGITVDKRRGYVWTPDFQGNNLTRFDPKTEEFIEYHLPTKNSSARFNGVDAQGRAWYGGFWSGKLGVVDPGDD